ncbi:60S ribosomal protein L21 [Trachipleistophora hominis]|uniref:60S ribosomal protein L21 n=1 Tax=Trachipleistophora hominis TaxID=72359 RepID=L7JRR3_TRAHO|nr:60S ribosomal protein L21 [Trachipleistophora hominis]
MTSSKGYRRQTRKRFSQPFRKHGMPSISTYLTTYKRGDYVDIKVNPAVHKGMPHKYYHGLTGKVAVVHKNSLTVRCTRRFGNKRIHRMIVCRVEHLRKSKCDEEFNERRKRNDELRKQAEQENRMVGCLKRVQKGPREAFFIGLDGNEPVELRNEPFVNVY